MLVRGLVGALVALLLALPASAAGQLPSGPTPLPGSAFQGGDGNQDDEGGFIDWQSQAGVVHSPDPNAQDNALTGGSKVLEPQDWDLTTEAGGVTPGKVNILDAWSAVEPRGADTFLYLAFTREDGTGTAAITFELNRDHRLWNNGHAKIPCRTTGDLLIATLPHGNAVGISMYHWTTRTADAATGCARTGTLTPVIRVPADTAQGSANADAITSRLGGFFPTGSQIPTYDFSEVALNLSALLAASGDDCLAYTSIWMHSRSANSESSNLQDYVTPRPLNLHTCAASGTKFYDVNGNGVRDPGEAGLERFLVWADYDNDGIHDANEPFSVTDADGNYVIDDIRPPSGSYRLRETLVSRAARRASATGWKCTFPNAATAGGFANGVGGLFGCGWGPIVSATTPYAQGRDFGNWVPAHLTVEKQLWPADDPGRFDLIVNGVTVLPGAGDGDHVTLELPAGTYNVSEVGAAGTNLADYDSDVNCRAVTRRRGTHRSGPAWNGLVLAAGAQATCTFVNVRKGAAVPAIDIEKSGPTIAQAGDTLHYTFDVTNPGNVPIPAGDVKVTDDTCDEAPALSSKNGDTSPGTLDHGDRWTYKCSHKTAEPGDDCEVAALTNVAVASATVGGVDVSDEGRITTTLECPDVPPEPPLPPDPGPDPAPTPTPEPEPLPSPSPTPDLPFIPPGGTVPDAGEGGVAGISSSNARCITRASQVQLTGQRMSRYRVSVDGRRLGARTLQLLQRRSFPLTRIFSPGRHRLTIVVTFERGSASPPVTLTRTIVVCGRAARAPRVTG